MKHLFVYGSLRKGMYHHQRYLEGKSRFRTYGYVKGKLCTLKGKRYPALVKGDGYVLGEVYRVNKDAAIAIDQLEGYKETDTMGEYLKMDAPVYDEEENCIGIYPVYYYNTSMAKYNELIDQDIVGNDFVRYVEEEQPDEVCN